MKNSQEQRSSAVWDFADVMNRVDNDRELLRDLLVMFQREFPQTIRSLDASVGAADTKNAVALSHKLKGMLSNLGGTRAAAAAADLEALASSAQKRSLDEAFACLKHESAALLAEVETYLSEVHR